MWPLVYGFDGCSFYQSSISYPKGLLNHFKLPIIICNKFVCQPYHVLYKFTPIKCIVDMLDIVSRFSMIMMKFGIVFFRYNE